MNDIYNGEHPTAADIAAFIDGGIHERDRARLILHFSDCDRCRREVVDVRDVLRSKPRRIWWIAPAAAATLAGLIFLGPWFRSGQGFEPHLRAGDESALAAFSVIGPTGASIVESGIEFTWQSAGPDALYTAELMDSTGNILWSPDATRDTILAFPRDSTLKPGPYFLTVEALRTDGTVMQTPTHRFVLNR